MEQIPSGQKESTSQSTDQKKHVALITRYIKKVIGENQSAGPDEEETISKEYVKKSPQEKASELYRKMIVYRLDLQEKAKKQDENSKPNPRLISRIKLLFNDPEVQALLPQTYGKARVDAKIFNASVKTWRRSIQELKNKRKEREQLEKDLYQEKIHSVSDRDEAKSAIVPLSLDIEDLEEDLEKMENLEGLPYTQENIDKAVMFASKRMQQYEKEFKKGFVWLPSRVEILDKTLEAISLSGNLRQTNQGVFFLSEPGTGKTELLRAASYRLTGDQPVTISCGPRTNEQQLLGRERIFPGAEKIEEATYQNIQEAVAGAWTGYDYSYQQELVRKYALVVEFDEMVKLFGNDNAFALLKRLFSLMDGDKMPGTDKKVLPRRFHFASGNLGARYGVTEIPKPIERHYRVIPVDFFEMSTKNPELYQFMLSALMEDGVIMGRKQELLPAYKERDLQEEKKIKLPNNEVIIGWKELINDPTSTEHGFLYRLAYAIKACQNSYMARGGANAYIDYTKRELLRYTDNADGTVSISETGNLITLETCIAPNLISGWITSYKTSKEKSKKTGVLTEWIQRQLKEIIEQRNEDRDKITTIFNHFHLFDPPSHFTGEEEIILPKEIGEAVLFLPRPVYAELPQTESTIPTEENTSKELKEYETTQVRLESGKRILLKKRDFQSSEIKIFETEDGRTIKENNLIPIGTTFRIKTEDFILAGVVEDPNHPDHGKPIGKPASEEPLYRIFTPQELDRGILNYEYDALIKDMAEKKQAVENFVNFT